MTWFLDILNKADESLIALVESIGIWAYLLFFLIVMCESGVLAMIFLPGDGFVFSIGVIAALGAMPIGIIYPILIIAACLGYHINFLTGKYLGEKWLKKKNYRWINAGKIEQAERFFKKYGKKAVFIGRFIPVIRTIIPFVAGVGNMNFYFFSYYNIAGGVLWVSLHALGGYFLGQLPFVQEHFLLLYLAMILIMTLPATWSTITYFRRRR